MLQDGKTPCIVHDERLPYPISHVEFNRYDYCVMLVCKVPRASKISSPKQGKKFEFPLDQKYVDLLEARRNVGVARIERGQVFDFKLYPVVFIPD